MHVSMMHGSLHHGTIFFLLVRQDPERKKPASAGHGIRKLQSPVCYRVYVNSEKPRSLHSVFTQLRDYLRSVKTSILVVADTLYSYFNTSSQMTFTLLEFVLSTLAVFVVYWMNCQRRGRNLPPGPKKYPLIGNLLSMPSTLEWETFAKWGQEYSP